MKISEKDLLKSLKPRSGDRLFAVFEKAGQIAAIEKVHPKGREHEGFGSFASNCFCIRIQNDISRLLSGNGHVDPGDEICYLQSTPLSPKGLFIAFRPTAPTNSQVQLIIEESESEAVAYWQKN